MCSSHSTIIYPASHPLLPAAPTRKSSEFSFLANCTSLLLLLYLQHHSLKPNPHSSHIPGVSGFIPMQESKHLHLSFSNIVPHVHFCWFVGWWGETWECVFVWWSACFCSASLHPVVSLEKKKKKSLHRDVISWFFLGQSDACGQQWHSWFLPLIWDLCRGTYPWNVYLT